MLIVLEWRDRTTMANNCQQKLAELPPSAKFVYYIIKMEGPLTQRAITEKSLLPPRTVRYALNRLEEGNIITKRVYLQDTRQRLYETDESKNVNSQSSEVAADD